jgi:hypothetical protein
MANPITGAVKIELDEVRELRWDINAMCCIEEEFGMSLEELFKDKQKRDRVNFQIVRAMLKAALQSEMPNITSVGAGKLLNYAAGETFNDKLTYVSEKIDEAVTEAFGKEQIAELKKEAAEEESKKKEATS